MNTETASVDHAPGTPSEAWRALQEGNSRFISGDKLHPHQDAQRRESLAESQKPFAVIFGCSDSRLAAEIIFLTHNEGLHEVNLGWHPRGEDLLWRPDLQQVKRSESGQWNVRYKSPWKGRWVAQLTDLIGTTLPECRIRYAF